MSRATRLNSGVRQADATATFAGRGKDGLVKPTASPIARLPLRLALPRWANVKPLLTGTNSPGGGGGTTPSTGWKDVAFNVDGSAPFLAWGSVAWTSTKYSLTNYYGSAAVLGLNGADMPWEFEFVTDSLDFAVKMTTGSTAFEMTVDDELVYQNTSNMPTGGSWLRVQWQGDRHLRRYQFKGNMGVNSIRMAVTDSIFAPNGATGPKVAWVGDSYSGIRGRNSLDGMARYVTAALGWKRHYIDAQGGSGYAQVGGSPPSNTFLSRVPALVAMNPDVIVYAGSHNASATEQANGFQGLRDSASAVFAQVRQSLPSVPIFAIGALTQGTTFENNWANSYPMLKAACDTYGVTFIDNRGWVYGTGNQGALTGDGNADVLVSADGTHYNLYGMEHISLRIAEAMTAAL